MLGAYGIIGNGTSIGIISSAGSLDWLCCPDSDMPSHFAALLDDRTGGRFLIRPSGKFSSSQKYLGNNQRSAVLETLFITPQGRGRLVDWMPWNSSPVMIRLVETLEGNLSWDLFCVPKFQYGQLSSHPERVSEGICFRAVSTRDFAQISGNQEIRLDTMLGAAISRFELKAGESRRFCWSWGRNLPRSKTFLKFSYQDCLREWDEWLHHCENSSLRRVCPSHPLWHDVFVRSEVVLRLLTHSGTGAIVQAPCASLPCVHGGSQNWDHRYCWIRNCPDALSAWISTGHAEEAENLWGWISDRILSNAPQEILSAYTLDGSAIPEERELHGLKGHGGARPVRVGNATTKQSGLDTISALLQCCELAYREFGIPKQSPLWPRIQELALMSAQLWRRPDQGIWDSRFRPEHYLSSKAACWKGLQSAISLFTDSQGSAPKRWLLESQRLQQTILREGFNSNRQAYTQAFGEVELDSSALLIGLWGIQAWDSPEVLSSLILIENELREGMFLRRNKNTHSSSDFDGAHLLSTLWWISSLIEVGRGREALELLTEICRISAPYGLLGEGLEPSTGAFLGDFPSSRIHSVFIQTALRASQSLEKGMPAKAAA